MKKAVVGIIAHVDSGKTTLSEAMLYTSGAIRSFGRVDNKDTFLDTFDMERERGITIFSKQARMELKDTEIILLDTPGHVDFSAEMERTLQVLDYTILVISGPEGIQSHTTTLWKLLSKYNIPTFVFINKMDRPGTDRKELMDMLQNKLDDRCVDFTDTSKEEFYESIALCDEKLMEMILEGHKDMGDEVYAHLIRERRVFPCFFGSALKLDGIEYFMEKADAYILSQDYSDEFGARVYKISEDDQGNRLTFMKVTGGMLKVKETLNGDCVRGRMSDDDGADEEITEWSEKVNQIRLYSGEKYQAVNEVYAGDICCVTGLKYTYPGQGLGIEKIGTQPFLEPVMTYSVIIKDDTDATVVLQKMKQLEEENPELNVLWEEEHSEIKVRIMGEVQIEILRNIIFERFGIIVEFGAGNIVYKETIASTVEGVGHFEPLRHYAEVHVLIEPLEEGSGVVIAAECSEDALDKNWQRLILTHLEEKEHRGVLTGSALTDVKITLVAGRAHKKHTEGGDFRQATYRAVRQGLMEAESVLLEPYYKFKIEVPAEYIGRVMTDMERMHGQIGSPYQEGEFSVLEGVVPVSSMHGYQTELRSFTKGQGRCICTSGGYKKCHNSEEVIEKRRYNPERDRRNTPDSVFCAHGSGFIVPWYQVKDYMHIEAYNPAKAGKDMADTTEVIMSARKAHTTEEVWLGTEEIDKILDRSAFANKKTEERSRFGHVVKHKKAESQGPVTRTYKKQEKKEKYLLVDGYNVIYAWKELNELAKVNVDSARGKLLDILCNYQAIKDVNLIVVFDAYRVKGHQTEILDYHNIHVVYTQEAETADQYIEKFAHNNSRNYDITVATSDGLEQIIIRGEGCLLMSSRELEEDVANVEQKLREEHLVT
ncbi:MAG: GTP-binding protein [Lachnospiraceae bacterium]|nr:GTP-binding protein [Lachnospiraceae bacterium]